MGTEGANPITKLQLCNTIKHALGVFFLLSTHPLCAYQPNTTYSETTFCKSVVTEECILKRCYTKKMSEIL